MALSPQQVTMYQGQALRARGGDAQALHFFSEVRREQMPGWQEIVAIYDALAGPAGQAAAHAFAGGGPTAHAPSPTPVYGQPSGQSAVGGLGGILDAPFLQKMQMTETQIRDNIRMTLLYAQGDADAMTYFSGCAEGASKGSVYSSRAVQLRDKILCSPQFGWTKVGASIVPPDVPVEEAPFEVTHTPDATADNSGVAAAAFAQVHAPQVVSAAQAASAVSGPASRRAALEAIAMRDRLEAEMRAAKAGGPPVQAQTPQPYVAPPQAPHAPHAPPAVAASAPAASASPPVTSVPPFDQPGTIETIQAAISDNRYFAASAVQGLLREIVHLRSKLAQSASQQPRAVAVAEPPAPPAAPPLPPNGSPATA
jgi:hypothetical protein